MNSQTHQNKTGTQSNEQNKCKVFASLYTDMWSLLQSSNMSSPMSRLPKDNMLRRL